MITKCNATPHLVILHGGEFLRTTKFGFEIRGLKSLYLENLVGIHITKRTSANLILVTISGAMYRFVWSFWAVVVLVSGQHNHPTSKSTKRFGIKFPKTQHNTPNDAKVWLGSSRRPVFKRSTRPATDMFTPYPTEYGCLYEGKWYQPGSEISRGYDGRSWCYGSYCDQQGQIMYWDNFKCSTKAPVATTIPTTTTTTPTTTLTPTTIPDRLTTVPPTPEGCYFNGKWFPPNTEISRGSSYGWCYGTFCDTQGDVISWDDWSCSTTSPPTTAPYLRTTAGQSTTEPPSGCLFEGWLYDFGSEISQTWNGGERCYGKRCSSDGEIITWLDFGCKTVQNYFKKHGCRYGGHFYHRGIEIFRKTPSGKCYESTCGKNGLKSWKLLRCKKESQFLSGYVGSSTCSYRGKSYPRGSIIYSRSLYRSHGYGWCVGTKCGTNGRVIAWGPDWAPGYC